jgi:hypothetical protein
MLVRLRLHSGQHVRDRLGAEVDDRDRAGAEVVFLVVADADGLEDRGEQVAGADLAVGPRLGVRVGLAVAGPALDAGPV